MKILASIGCCVVLVPAFVNVGSPAVDVPAEFKPGRHAKSMTHGGVKRTYRMYIPKKRDATPAPLVLAIHGAFTDGLVMEGLTGFNRLADKHGFIAVYPDGINRIWRFWGNEDVDYVTALVDDLVAKKLADPRRVYATGLSNGAYFSHRLGYDQAKRFAAIAPVSGTLVKLMAESAPKQALKMPVLYIHGTDDRITGYDGKDMFTKTASSMRAEDMVAWWAKRNGCEQTPKVEKLPDKEDDKTRVERWCYPPAKDGAEVIFYKVIGGGHTWPGELFQPEFILGRTCMDFNASEAIWDFFSRHQRRP